MRVTKKGGAVFAAATLLMGLGLLACGKKAPGPILPATTQMPGKGTSGSGSASLTCSAPSASASKLDSGVYQNQACTQTLSPLDGSDAWGTDQLAINGYQMSETPIYFSDQASCQAFVNVPKAVNAGGYTNYYCYGLVGAVKSGNQYSVQGTKSDGTYWFETVTAPGNGSLSFADEDGNVVNYVQVSASSQPPKMPPAN